MATADLFMKGAAIPCLSAQPVKRGAPMHMLAAAFGFNLAYSLPLAVYLYSAVGPKQFFLAALAAVGVIAGQGLFTKGRTTATT